METSTIIWIIVGIIVIIAIVVIVMLVTRRRRHEAHLEAERKKAADLRQNAYESDVARREREADAAAAAAAAKQAEADAMAARLESERLARESAAHQADAQQLRTETDERLRKADAVDPDVVTDESAAAARDPRDADAARTDGAAPRDERVAVDDRDVARDERADVHDEHAAARHEAAAEHHEEAAVREEQAAARDDGTVADREPTVDAVRSHPRHRDRSPRLAWPSRRVTERSVTRRRRSPGSAGLPPRDRALDEDPNLVDELIDGSLVRHAGGDHRDRERGHGRWRHAVSCAPARDLGGRGREDDAAQAHPGMRRSAHRAVLPRRVDRGSGAFRRREVNRRPAGDLELRMPRRVARAGLAVAVGEPFDAGRIHEHRSERTVARVGGFARVRDGSAEVDEVGLGDGHTSSLPSERPDGERARPSVRAGDRVEATEPRLTPGR